MFIEWLSQLLAFVPTPLGSAAVQVVKIIALDYPGALSYSWRSVVDVYNGIDEIRLALLRGLTRDAISA